MRLLSFAGVSLYAVLLASSVTSAPAGDEPGDPSIPVSDPDRLSELPDEMLSMCVSYLTWKERVPLLSVNKRIRLFLSRDQNLGNLDSKALCQKYFKEGRTGDLQVATQLLNGRTQGDVHAALGPYWVRSYNLLSPLQPVNHVLLSTLAPEVLQEHMPFLSMAVDPQSKLKFDNTMVFLIATVIKFAVSNLNSDMAEFTIGFWVWRDILKVAVLNNNPQVARIAIARFSEFHVKWYRDAYHAYYGEFNTTDHDDWEERSMADDSIAKNSRNDNDQIRIRPEVDNAGKSFRMWQRALFWTWAIELGYDEVRKVLKPTYENWTTEDYNRLTTIMCQLNVSKVCDYLKTLDYTPGAPIAFNQMTIAQRLQELPNPYMNWDPENPRQVWVAKPEDQQMAEPLQVDSPIDV